MTLELTQRRLGFSAQVQQAGGATPLAHVLLEVPPREPHDAATPASEYQLLTSEGSVAFAIVQGLRRNSQGGAPGKVVLSGFAGGHARDLPRSENKSKAQSRSELRCDRPRVRPEDEKEPDRRRSPIAIADRSHPGRRRCRDRAGGRGCWGLVPRQASRPSIDAQTSTSPTRTH
jgi:hypothetical protein